MDQNQTSALQAALERAAATMRNSGSSGSGLFPPMDFGGPGMFNPTPMASQGQPGMQPTPNAQVANRFGGMQPPSQPQQAMAYAPPDPNRGNMTVPMPQSRPAAAPQPQPEMGFFQRNAAMMRDPATGAFIDPQGAARAQQQDQGGLIQKMLGYLGSKQS